MGFHYANEHFLMGDHGSLAAKVRQAEADYMNALRDFGHESAEALASKRHLEWLRGLKRRSLDSGSVA